ncbi:MAG: S24/S26 family peptidase, partial [Nitrospinae bacterium]|nr:S24/S26 family peptidase [Nitrospinota bacterium]
DENIEAGDTGNVTLEVLAEVGAGSARAVAPDEPEHITIGKSFLRGHANSKLFALRIAGESMAPELRTGDIVICEKTVGDLTRIQRDKMYCVRLDEQDGSTIKKLMYVPSAKELLLLPLNPACDPEPIKLHGGARSPVRGVVVAVFRYLNNGK